MFQLLLKETSISCLVSELQPTCTPGAPVGRREMAAHRTARYSSGADGATSLQAYLKNFPWDFGLRHKIKPNTSHVPGKRDILVKRGRLFSTVVKCENCTMANALPKLMLYGKTAKGTRAQLHSASKVIPLLSPV